MPLRSDHISRFLLFAAIIAVLVGGTVPGSVRAQDATPEAECVSTTPEENTAIAHAYWEEFVWGDQGKIAEIVAPDEVHHWGLSETTTGFEAFAAGADSFNNAFPDLRFTVDLAVAQDDLVATLWTATGTQSGEWQGMPASNNEAVWQGINILRFECGMVVESWSEANHLGLLAQIGSTDVPAFLADTAAPEGTPIADASAATPCAGDSPDANLALVERWTTEVWVGQDLAVLEEIASPDILHHGGAFPDAHGLEAVKEGIQNQLAAFPDMDLTVDQSFAEEDLVVVRWSGTGTNEGEFIGLAPTGQETTMSGINIYRVNCGQIVESWSEISGLSLLRQIQGSDASATPAA